MKKQKVSKNAKFKKLPFCKKLTKTFKLFNVSILHIQSVRCQHKKLWHRLNSMFMHYLSTQDPYEGEKSGKKNAYFKMLSFCRIKYFLAIKYLHASPMSTLCMQSMSAAKALVQV